MIKIEKLLSEKSAVKIEDNQRGVHLLTMNNGYQWSGANIYNIEIAKAAVEVLQDYIKSVEDV